MFTPYTSLTPHIVCNKELKGSGFQTVNTKGNLKVISTG